MGIYSLSVTWNLVCHKLMKLCFGQHHTFQHSSDMFKLKKRAKCLNFIKTINLEFTQYDYKNTILIQKYSVNPKIQYNYSNNNYIPELLLASVVVDGEFLLEWCEHFGQPQVWYIHN